MKYRVYALLPRTESPLLVFEDADEYKARHYCNKNIKYFPELTIISGSRLHQNLSKETFLNPDFKDRCRDYVPDAKIGRIKRKSRFIHHIIYEDETRVSFLIKYKRNEARVCIIDAEDKSKVFGLIKKSSDLYRVKIFRGALPLVYYRYRSNHHMTLMELIFDKKKFGFVTFKDGNPYNYMKDNVMFSKVSMTQNHPKGATGYYGVYHYPKWLGRKKYLASMKFKGKRIEIGRFMEPLTAAKYYDKKRMELMGRSAAKNFPYEYYAAFEPFYVSNVN